MSEVAAYGKIKNKYAKGARFEHKVMEDLEALGYSVVRSAGSKGGHKLDLVAFHPDMPMMLIQCKTGGSISKEEWDRVLAVAGWYPGVCVPVLASNGPNGRGVTYLRLEGQRIPYARVQPASTYHPDPDPVALAVPEALADLEADYLDRQSPDYHG